MSKKKLKKHKNKKTPKLYVNFGKSKFTVNDLNNQVNIMDKEYGCRLKHPEIWREPEHYKKSLMANAEMNFAAIACVVNGLDVKDYFQTFEGENGQYGTTVSIPIGIMNPAFRAESLLEWDNHKQNYETDSLKFRCRLATCISTRLIGRMDKITKREAIERKGYKHSIDEAQIVITKEIQEDTMRLTRLLINPGNSFVNSFLKMNEHMFYSKRKIRDRVKLRSRIKTLTKGITFGLKSNPFTERLYSDDLAIHEILELSYLLSTSDLKGVKHAIPNFKYVENATVDHDLFRLIEVLGESILKNCKGDITKVSPMFKAFMNARPKIITSYYKEARDNVNIRMGLYALEMAKFCMDDKNTNKFVSKMMRKGK